MLDCLVVGPGGVGGFVAARLAVADARVGVVARGAHGEAIATAGLQLVDPELPNGRVEAQVAVAASLAVAPAAPVVVLAVKHPDLDGVLAQLPGYLERCPSDTVVVALQNGVAHLDRLATLLGPGRGLVGAVYIFSSVLWPGVVEVVGGPRLFRIGPLDGRDPLARARAAEVVARWRRAGIRSSDEDDGRRVAWEKLVLLAPLSGMTALTGRSVGELRSLPQVMSCYRAMAEEVAEIAGAEGVAVAPGLVEAAAAGLQATDADGRSSLWLDLSRGRASEIDVLLGDPVRRADGHGLAAPVLRTVEALTRARWLAGPASGAAAAGATRADQSEGGGRGGGGAST